MTAEVDDIGGDVVMRPLKLLRLEGFHDVSTEINAIGWDVVIWLAEVDEILGMS